MIDSLMEVTARFFKAGTVSYVQIEDEIELTNYGRVYGDGDDEELWEYVPGTPNPHYIIKKDFIGFSFRTFDFGDFGDSHCSGTSFEGREGTLIESLADSTDEFVTYAKEEKAACDAKRQGKNTSVTPSLFPGEFNTFNGKKWMLAAVPDEVPETDCVKFIVALDYHCEQSGGYYEPDEYSSWVEVVGKVDMSRIREIIGNRVDALTGVRSRVDKFSLA